MSWVILQPHSSTNPTNNYRVVDSTEWMRFVNGAQDKGYAVAGEFPEYERARALKDQLNKD